MSVVVRDDLAEAHRLAWEHIAAPGQLVVGRRASRARRYCPAGDRRRRPAGAVGRRHLDRTARPRARRAACGSRRRLPSRPSRRHDDRRRVPRRRRRARRAPVRRAVRDRVDRRCGRPLLSQHRRRGAAATGADRRSTDGKRAPSAWRRPSSTGCRSPSRPMRWPRSFRPTPRSPTSSSTPGAWPTPSTCRAPEMVDPDWSRRPGGLSRAQMELVAARLTRLRDCFY